MCEAAFRQSLDTRVATETGRGTRELIIVPESGARWWVGKRALAFWSGYDGSRGLLVDWEQDHDLDTQRVARPGVVSVAMTRECLIR